MSKKTEVLRLTKEESAIISTIRSLGVDKVVSEFTNILNSDSTTSTDCLKSMRAALQKDTLFTLEDLVSQNNISEHDANLLIEAFNTNKNIAITGASKTGKTTLLKLLIASSERSDNPLCIVDSHYDWDTKNVFQGKNIIDVKTDAMSTKNLYDTILNSNIKRLIIPELSKAFDTITAITAIFNEIPLLYTSTTEGNPLPDSPSLVKGVALEVINRTPFVTARCHIQDNLFKVEVTQP